ncbi:PQQ-dependent sugar dehydrogenase [Pseudalkalibacillus hwajinpoensis]|uniref:PQQ-dependent sugar dehydrogenase n=1 Tax=Guptibacillus hwajinpoensis TaxID=208199 RepID=UPI00325B8A92
MLKLSRAVVIVMLVTGCAGGNEGSQEAPTEEMNKEIDVVVENLNVPWEITKSDNTFYLTERSGTIVEVANGKVTRQPVDLSFSVHDEGEGGLLGMQLQDFSSSSTAFIYHTYQEQGVTLNRIVKVKLENGVWKETEELLSNIPGAQFHNGGRIKLGPDGKLYITTGDAGQPELAQDVTSLAGKILRMNVDGTVPEDNPFEHSFVYSFGHRNPQGLAWDKNGQLYNSEHGQSAHDEINEIEAGKNYGWPEIEGDEEKEGMETPLYHSGNDTWAPSGMLVYDDLLYVAGLRGEEIRTFKLDGSETKKYVDSIGRIRSLYQEESMLYAITNNRDGRGNPVKEDDRMVKIGVGE